MSVASAERRYEGSRMQNEEMSSVFSYSIYHSISLAKKQMIEVSQRHIKFPLVKVFLRIYNDSTHLQGLISYQTFLLLVKTCYFSTSLCVIDSYICFQYPQWPVFLMNQLKLNHRNEWTVGKFWFLKPIFYNFGFSSGTFIVLLWVLQSSMLKMYKLKLSYWIQKLVLYQ